MQSHEGAISLLRTLPPSWHSGQIANIRCRGGHRASVAWRDGALASATITAGRAGELVVDVPDIGLVVTGPAGPIATEAATAVPDRRRFAWSASAGTRYSLTLL